jgi:hypothetical protein
MSLERVQAMGILVEPEAAVLIENGGEAAVNRIVDKLAGMPGKPLSLDKAMARKLLLPDAKRVKRIEQNSQQGIGDLVAAWGERFSTIQRLLMRRPELSTAVSIGSATGQCAVIGQVRIGGAKVELEDPTGAVELILPAQPAVLQDRAVVMPDDVIGVVGGCEAGVLRADGIMWPDLPLRAVMAGQGKVLIGGGAGDADWRIEPAGTEWWEIGGTRLLIHRADWAALAEKLKVKADDVPVEMLKRRHLFRPPCDAIENAPDVLVAVGLDLSAMIYKGTRIVGSKEGVLIDLEATR